MKTVNYEFKKIKVLGVTTDFNTCECCGKTDLAKTVSILDLNSEVILHFGIVCASKAEKFDNLESAKMAKKEIDKAVRTFNERIKQAGITAFRILSKKHGLQTLADGSYAPKIDSYESVWVSLRNEIVAFYSNSENKFKPFQSL